MFERNHEIAGRATYLSQLHRPVFFSTSVSFRCVRMTLTDRETILWSFGQLCSSLSINKCKKLQFIHTVNGDGSKTAKIIKRQC